VNASEPFATPHGHSFNQHAHDLQSLVQWNAQFIQGTVWKIAEFLFALFALVTLDSFGAEKPRLFAF
jgi:hypothetical protein